MGLDEETLRVQERLPRFGDVFREDSEKASGDFSGTRRVPSENH